MKKAIALLLVFVLVAPSFAAVTATSTQKAVAKPKVKAAIKKTIKPGAAEAMSIAPTKEAVPAKPKEISFKDVTKKDPNYQSINKAVIEYEVMSGYPDGTFKPNKTVITKEAADTIKKGMSYLEKKWEIPLLEKEIAAPVKTIELTKEAVIKTTTKEAVVKTVTKEASAAAKAKKPIVKAKKPVVKKPALKKKVVVKAVVPQKPMTRYELAAALAAAIKRVYSQYELELPDLSEKAKKTATKEVKIEAIKSLTSEAKVGTPEAKTGTPEVKAVAVKVKKPVVKAKPAVKAKVKAKAVKKVEVKAAPILPAIAFLDVKENSPAMADIKLLRYFGIMDGREAPKPKPKLVKGKAVKPAPKKAQKELLFEGDKAVTRADLAVAEVKFIEKCNAIISKIPADKRDALKRKYGLLGEAVAAPKTPVEKYMSMGKEKAYVAGSYGHVYESSTTTSNWLGFAGSALYGNNFSLLGIKGDYELTGKYGYNQVIYYVPNGGGGITGGVVNENRFDIDANTVYPVVNFYGFEGKLLLGLKYAALNNPLAATNFMALNAGVATVLPVMGQKVLGRAFYSLMPSTSAKNASVLGQPTSLLNYEAGTDVEIFKTPMTVGYSGETMFINGAYSRFYNMVFVRYNLL